MSFPLVDLSSAALLLIFQGCAPSGQVLTTPAPRERAAEAAPDRPKIAERPVKEDDLVRGILTAKYPHVAEDGFRSLFELVGNDSLPRLQMHASDTIAIQSAWMQVELTIPAEKPRRAVRPDHEKLAWFLGSLEERARVRPPKWWAEAVQDARANYRGNVYAGGLLIRSEHRKPGDRVAEEGPAKATIDRREGGVVVRLGKESASLPDDFTEKDQKQVRFDEVPALFTPTRCYVAIHDDAGSPYRLWCVERSPSRLRWVTDVWGSWWGGTSGQHCQWVEIVEQGDRVVVFGVASTGFHVEAFSADDGANLFRFSNSYTLSSLLR